MGENLARVRTKPGNEIGFAVDGWMKSAVHRGNILRADYTQSAVGVARSADGTTYLVQVFASPR
ncbi:MAG: CAP domain-containing protein [Fibrella sp.]|nr:CAP domain-containing protein [Armatimonadota bacterium]